VTASGSRKGKTPDAVLELLHGRMFLLALAQGSLGGDDDHALEAFVQMPAKHHVKLILSEANNGRHVIAMLPIAAVEYDANACAVAHTQRCAVAQQQSIVALLDPFRRQHRLRVAAPVIEQHLHPTEIIVGERRPMDGLLDQVAGVVRAKGTIAENDRLEALAALGAAGTENLTRDPDMAALHHHAREFAKDLDQFVKHAVPHNKGRRRGGSLQQRKDQENMNAAREQ
jgi:Terminase Bacteriophage T7, Ribonuclease H-like domain